MAALLAMMDSIAGGTPEITGNPPSPSASVLRQSHLDDLRFVLAELSGQARTYERQAIRIPHPLTGEEMGHKQPANYLILPFIDSDSANAIL
jgi:hypothetical protein